MIFDTHCHYNLDPLTADWQKHWQTAQARGIQKSVVVGTSLETTELGIQIAATDKNLSASLGIHPHVFQDSVVENGNIKLEQLPDLIHQLTAFKTDKIVAIGETGLDYFWLPEIETQRKASIELQEAGFIAQIELANQLQLPLIIHVRDKTDQAYHRVLTLLTQYYQHHKPFILHCVSGPLSYLKAAIELGGYIGVAGNVTYKNADHIRQLVTTAPPDRILLETDAPYLPPQNYRGQTCEPWMISETHAFLVNELKLDSEQLYQNALSIFNLK